MNMAIKTTFLRIHRTIFKNNGNLDGFSMMEILVVVGIVGVLASIASPKVDAILAKSKQQESRGYLQKLAVAQKAYHIKNGVYLAMAPVGFGNSNSGAICVDPMVVTVFKTCAIASDLKYSYEVVLTVPGFTATSTSGTGSANGVLKDCAADSWQVDQNGIVTAVNDVTKTCN